MGRATASFTDMLKDDRQRSGLTVVQAARCLGVSPATYREIEADTRPPSFETWDRICETYGWPQTFVGSCR